MKEFHPFYIAKYPDDSIYVYNLGIADNILVSAASDNTLRLWDRETLKTYKVIHEVHDHISDMKISGNHSILTCGEEGTAKIWDTRTLALCGQFKPGFKINIYKLSLNVLAKKMPLLCISENIEKTMIAAGSALLGSDAYLFLWDQRKQSLLFSYKESQNDDITDVRFDSIQSHRLCAGGCDGLINIFDTRFSIEDDAIINVFNNQSSIHRADFLGPNKVLGLSHMETLSLYNINDISRNNTDNIIDSTYISLGDLRSKLNCNYVIDIILNITKNTAYICCGSHTGKIRLFEFHQDATINKDEQILLQGHDDSIARSLVFDQQMQIIYTGSENGEIRANRYETLQQTPPTKKIKLYD
ncbi:hypothetical protein PNEG_00782 [Pneumocystis murina B123]|uniref:Uncharacterized protein n=1 Tax=Pneumocystis murina (strain B123) TaxID=1069680 RepID=M7PL39_PNEMU|nr:hypothetical protein PNEG_00782 [Pneumocystis murina B123]EMR11189.1 hypothetical protein PNEG_00782 [Pneumocystis murina B123]